MAQQKLSSNARQTTSPGTPDISNATPTLKAISYQKQYDRQHPAKELPGLRERYPLRAWWADQMGRLEGVGYNPDRFKE